MNKTVYFLGAGFSKDAGGPIQNGIIETIFKPQFKDAYNHKKEIIDALLAFSKFLGETLLIDKIDFSKIPLEDVFTPIDRCIADGKSFRQYSIDDLVKLRDKLHTLMAASIQYGVDIEYGNSSYITDFARYINNIAKQRLDDGEDRISIITTNWDILLDNRLNDAIRMSPLSPPKLAVVDYCCYISSLEEDENIKPGLFALGKRGYNIKYLKLHGSMNWLHCPFCQRMYVKFDEKTMLSPSHFCKHCKKNYKLNDIDSIKLRGNLMLPTFLKDLNNIQIKLIWQNAAIELSEASKIVFIGYSLPAADFEIRQLLSRYIRKNAKIEVIVHPQYASAEEINRYKLFFGKRNINFISKTIPNYVDNLP